MQSKAERFQSLNGGIGQSFTNQMAEAGSNQEHSFTGNYSLQSEMVLYIGNKLNNTISQNELLVKSGELTVKEAENNKEHTITAAYLKILYAKESVVNAENILISSEKQNERAKVLFESGYIAESNYAQVQSQYISDKYALVVASNNLNLLILQLNQILQLGINDNLSIQFPVLDDNQVLKALPVKQDVYNTALNSMPEVENSKVNMDVAAIDLDIAKAGLLPSLSLSASLATGHSSLGSENYATQLGNNFYQNGGLSLNIPVFNKKQVKSSISKAQIGIETLTTDYYSSIGLDIRDTHAKSDLYEKPAKNQHAYCIDIDNQGDVRVLCKIKPNASWMGTILHEFGHANYDKYIDQQLPFALRNPAHTFATEAIAMFFGRMSSNTGFLVDMKLTDKADADKVAAEGFKVLRLEQLTFSRWAQVMHRFEKNIVCRSGSE